MKRRPILFRRGWLACLVGLPVLLLMGVGVFSLRQDRNLARLEAQERAQALANEMRDRLTEALAPRDSHPREGEIAFRVDAHGHLLSPPPCTEVPEPQTLPLTRLTPGQRAWWEQLSELKSNADPQHNTIKDMLHAFLNSQPPDSLAALSMYRTALRLAGRGHQATAEQLFGELLERHPSARTESGLPLAPLVALKLLVWHGEAGGTNFPPLLESACSNAVWHPSILTPQLLAAARRAVPRDGMSVIPRWEHRWASHQAARRLHAAMGGDAHFSKDRSAAQAAVTPALSWISLPAEARSAVVEASEQRDEGRTKPQPHPFPRRTDWPEAPTPLASNAVAKERWGSPIPLAVHDPSGIIRLGTALAPPSLEEWLLAWQPESDGTWHCHAWPRGELAQWLTRPPSPLTPHQAAVLTVTLTDDLSRQLATAGQAHPVHDLMARMPSYFGITIEAAGQRLAPDGFPAEAASRILATSFSGSTASGLLAVHVHLLRPDELFARQRARTLWFGALLGLSLITAVVGFVAVWRAWRKQERLAAMKTNFVSSVSHELRAPIASVRLLAEGLEQGDVREPGRQHEYYRFIVQECRRLSAMVENVLDISRIEQDRKEYSLEESDARALTSDTVQRMRPYAAEAGVTLQWDAPDEGAAWTDALDAVAMQQALVNLIDNAIKHSPRKAAVSVTLSRPNASALRWTITDQGPGVPPAARTRIFERFYRIGSELKRDTQGAGIGLNIVQHIARAHGGKVWVEDGPGGGARFVLEIPIPCDASNTNS